MVRGKNEARFSVFARLFFGFSSLRPKSPGKTNPTPKASPPAHAIRRRVRHQPIPVFHPPQIPKPAGKHPTRATEGAWSLRTATDFPVPVFVAKTIPRHFFGLHLDQPRFGLTLHMQYQYCIVLMCHVSIAIGKLSCEQKIPAHLPKPSLYFAGAQMTGSFSIFRWTTARNASPCGSERPLRGNTYPPHLMTSYFYVVRFATGEKRVNGNSRVFYCPPRKKRTHQNTRSKRCR